MLQEGKKAPAFKLQDQNGDWHALKDYAGKNVVLYFYPKDNTPGCTTEAIDFTQSKEAFTEKNAVIFGVSKDSITCHKGFEEKQNLAITLLSDPETEIIQKYGVWQEKKNYGKTYMGIVRTTFLIDESGNIKKIWPQVKVKGHVKEVLESI